MTTLKLIEANKRLMTAWMNIQYAIEEIESANDKTPQAQKMDSLIISNREHPRQHYR